ncbi:MAG: hypothetical protein LBD41_06395 [Clostridiales Family XIII bacterium]|jgi:hypothetical protein|nr:hypothetical protein [Clostridiales Family XIII bacterium]
MIAVLYSMAFVSFFFAIVFIVRPNKKGFDELVYLFKKNNRVPLKTKIIEAQNVKVSKIKSPALWIAEVNSMLKTMNKQGQFRLLVLFSIIFAFSSCVISFATFNFFLIPTGCLIAVALPIIFVTISYNRFLKALNSSLEASLAVITASYLRSEDILTAVSENIPYLSEPVKSVFAKFLFLSREINPDITANLESIKNKIPNEIWGEWIDTVILSYEDKSLNKTLKPIVDKLSKKQNLTKELESEAYQPLREFVMLSILGFCNIFIIRFMNKEWFEILITNIVGKLSIALMLIVIILGVFKALSLTKVVSYTENDLPVKERNN